MRCSSKRAVGAVVSARFHECTSVTPLELHPMCFLINYLDIESGTFGTTRTDDLDHLYNRLDPVAVVMISSAGSVFVEYILNPGN